jgi:hypothetical protein
MEYGMEIMLFGINIWILLDKTKEINKEYNNMYHNYINNSIARGNKLYNWRCYDNGKWEENINDKYIWNKSVNIVGKLPKNY